MYGSGPTESQSPSGQRMNGGGAVGRVPPASTRLIPANQGRAGENSWQRPVSPRSTMAAPGGAEVGSFPASALRAAGVGASAVYPPRVATAAAGQARPALP